MLTRHLHVQVADVDLPHPTTQVVALQDIARFA
jgi:hypothetical protein